MGNSRGKASVFPRFAKDVQGSSSLSPTSTRPIWIFPAAIDSMAKLHL